METYIMSYGVPLFIITDLLFIVTIYIDRDGADETFSLLSPILVALFYTFAVVPVSLLLYSNGD